MARERVRQIEIEAELAVATPSSTLHERLRAMLEMTRTSWADVLRVTARKTVPEVPWAYERAIPVPGAQG